MATQGFIQLEEQESERTKDQTQNAADEKGKQH